MTPAGPAKYRIITGGPLRPDEKPPPSWGVSQGGGGAVIILYFVIGLCSLPMLYPSAYPQEG